MKPTPWNWTRIAPTLFYKEAGKAIDWLCEVLGFEVRLRIEGDAGRIEHSELTFGPDGLIMVAEEEDPKPHAADRRSPATIGGANTQSLMIYVDDALAHCERARGLGARILTEPKVSDYGEDYWSDRSYELADLEGHRWWICERLRSPEQKPKQPQQPKA